MSRKGFVFTGMALLLVIPAMLLAASFSNMVVTGNKATSTTMRSDVLFYAADNVRDSFERTADELIYRSRCGETDVDAVKTNFTTVWAPYIEGTFAASKGLGIEFDESKINVTLANQRFNIFNIDTGEGIPIVIFDLEENMKYVFSIGPLNIRAYGAPTATITLPDVYNISYDEGDPIDFDASDSYDPTGDALTYSWTSDIDGFLSNQESFTTATLTNGSHTITLAVDDGDCGEDYTSTLVQLNLTQIGWCEALGYFTGTCENTPDCPEDGIQYVHEAAGDGVYCDVGETCCEHTVATWCESLAGGYTTGACSIEESPATCANDYPGSTHEAAGDATFCSWFGHPVLGDQQWVCCWNE